MTCQSLVCGARVSSLPFQEVVGEGLWALLSALKCLAFVTHCHTILLSLLVMFLLFIVFSCLFFFFLKT